MNALTAPVDFDPVSGQVGPQPGAAPAAANRPKEVPGLTRPYRYNELIGAQGGLTALHFAARQGAAQAVAALVDGGVAVNQPSPGDKATPLLVALINGHFDIAAYLLQHGADPNLVSDAGGHLAAPEQLARVDAGNSSAITRASTSSFFWLAVPCRLT